MSALFLIDKLKSALGRSRAIEIGRARGFDHPWTVATTVIATGIDVVMTPLAYVCAWAESSVGWAVDIALAPLALALALPFVGRAAAWILALAQTLVWGLVALPDGLLTLLGILPEKRLRVRVLLDSDASASVRGEVVRALDVAAQIYRRQANVRLVSAEPWTFRGAFAGASKPTDDWLVLGEGDVASRGVGCGVQAAGEDIGLPGWGYAWGALRHHLFGVARRLLGSGAPVVVFSVASVDDNRLIGCSLGPLTDYVTIQLERPICVAHELGHACNLLHTTVPGNLMNPTCGGVHLTRGQVVLLRLSRHVSYL